MLFFKIAVLSNIDFCIVNENILLYNIDCSVVYVPKILIR